MSDLVRWTICLRRDLDRYPSITFLDFFTFLIRTKLVKLQLKMITETTRIDQDELRRIPISEQTNRPRLTETELQHQSRFDFEVPRITIITILIQVVPQQSWVLPGRAKAPSSRSCSECTRRLRVKWWVDDL